MEPDNNMVQQKSWQEIYWEEQSRKEQEQTAGKKKRIGLVLLITGALYLLAGLGWNLYRGEFFGGAKDVLRADYSGQRAYTYMLYMSGEVPYESEDAQMQVRYVLDQYGYEAVIFVDEDVAEKYEDYCDESNWYVGKLKEVRLNGYATAYGEEEKAYLWGLVTGEDTSALTETDNEEFERTFGKYYLKVDEASGIKAFVAWLLVVAGVAICVIGGLIYTGKIQKISSNF